MGEGDEHVAILRCFAVRVINYSFVRHGCLGLLRLLLHRAGPPALLPRLHLGLVPGLTAKFGHGIANGMPMSMTPAQSQHGHSTATTRPRHSHGTGSNSVANVMPMSMTTTRVPRRACVLACSLVTAHTYR